MQRNAGKYAYDLNNLINNSLAFTHRFLPVNQGSVRIVDNSIQYSVRQGYFADFPMPACTVAIFQVANS